MQIEKNGYYNTKDNENYIKQMKIIFDTIIKIEQY